MPLLNQEMMTIAEQLPGIKEGKHREGVKPIGSQLRAVYHDALLMSIHTNVNPIIDKAQKSAYDDT